MSKRILSNHGNQKSTGRGKAMELKLLALFAVVLALSLPRVVVGECITVSYDADSGTTYPVTLDASTLPAGNIEIALNTSTLPPYAAVYAGKKLPMVRIPTSLRTVTAADFTDMTDGLPAYVTGRTIEVDAVDGMQTASLTVSIPFVELSDSVTSANPQYNGQWYIYIGTTWKSGDVSNAKDYWAAKSVKNTLRTGAQTNGGGNFGGRTLTLD